jgi:hypothetical protein
MAVESVNVTSIIVEANEFPDLIRKYQVSGVPKTVINDRVEILGARAAGLPGFRLIRAWSPCSTMEKPAARAAGPCGWVAPGVEHEQRTDDHQRLGVGGILWPSRHRTVVAVRLETRGSIEPHE